MSKENTEKQGKQAATAAVAAVTAASVLAGSLFSTPADLLKADDPSNKAYIDTVDFDDGVDDTDPDDDQDLEKTKKRGMKAALRESILCLPLAVRLLVVLPLWAAGQVVIAVGSALWTAASPLLERFGGFLLLAAVLLAAFTLAAKAIFPDLPLKKILNRRTVPALVLCALALSLMDRVLPLVWEDYERARRWLMAGGSLLALGGASTAFALRERKRRAEKEVKQKAAEPPKPPERLTFTDGSGVFTLRR